ncbi:MAG: cytochrome c maturation protein CcmE [Bacteroidota bacterium]
MKNLQKIILPGLVVIIVALIYFTYFSPSDELGDFSKLSTNSNASVQIIVKYVSEKGISRDREGNTLFYVVDKNNKEVKVSGPGKLPPGMDEALSLVLTGHLNNDHFHAHGIELRN